ncbi:MAG: nuclease [Cyanobacteria bacterium QS_8_64_29]|nr:MAG: nuclease [Cyanobacteria bacterium QS_8_64_29]
MRHFPYRFWTTLLLAAVLGLGLLSAPACAQSGSTRIPDIQGAGHRTPLDGERVAEVPGIATATTEEGFFMQAPTPDGKPATSDGIFVYTAEPPAVEVADAVSVMGTAQEYLRSDRDRDLTVTEIDASEDAATVMVTASGKALPEPTVIGRSGRKPPARTIDDDGLSAFEPRQDGIDFYESLEGMRVRVDSALVTGPTRGDRAVVLADGGRDAQPQTWQGGVAVDPNDFNPERIGIDGELVGGMPAAAVGDRFAGPITGVLDYNRGHFELLATQPLPDLAPAELARERSDLSGAAERLRVATFNVENLDPGDGDHFEALAAQIVEGLKAPEVLALAEVQDNSGPTDDGTVAADATYRQLIEAIGTAQGPRYAFTDIAPADGRDGGQPGGNIRVGLLYRPDRIALAERPKGDATTATAVRAEGERAALSLCPGRIEPASPAFEDSRKPLAAEFRFNGERLFVIGNHFVSKGGDAPLFGAEQPPPQPSRQQRNAQAKAVNRFANELLAINPDANIVVLGDLNDFAFSPPLQTLKGDALRNLTETLPRPQRYSYIFQGNAQTLDHILVSDALAQAAQADIVHLNAGFRGASSDHDPAIARLSFEP